MSSLFPEHTPVKKKPGPKARTPQCGHPQRKHFGKGMCQACYRATPSSRAKENASCRERNHKAYHAPDGRMKRAYRDYQLQKDYGISLPEYEAMIASQHGVCAICGNAETSTHRGIVRRLSVDHCHTSGKVRALLCARCNLLIGSAAEDAEILRAALAYLEKHALSSSP